MLHKYQVRPASTRESRRLLSAGFTLIEVMMVIAIVSMLVSIALPSYIEHVARARRADARTQLLQVAQFMQRFYAANDNYQEDRANNPVVDQVPANLKKSPPDAQAVYTLEIPTATLTRSKFELRMVPVAGGPMATDKCGIFALDSLGVRTVIVNGVSDTSSLRDSCWK